jgi:hypothetical protein
MLPVSVSAHLSFRLISCKVCGEPQDKLKADSHIACRAHAVPLPRRAVKGLDCVFPT